MHGYRLGGSKLSSVIQDNLHPNYCLNHNIVNDHKNREKKKIFYLHCNLLQDEIGRYRCECTPGYTLVSYVTP